MWHTLKCHSINQFYFYFNQILTAFNELKIMSEVTLLLANTDRPQQVEDYIRGYTTSSEYWPPLTSWRICQRLHYFYQMLTDLNRLRIMSEIALLLPNTDDFKQLNIMSEVALLLVNTERPQSAEDYVRGCTTSSEYWPPSTSWRLCQRMHYF
jgi:uncharacterized protein (DUF1684 family)